jgi:hypothetical protein
MTEKEKTDSKKVNSSVVLKYSVQTTLYLRLLQFKKERGLKDSAICILALDEFLTKNNF